MHSITDWLRGLSGPVVYAVIGGMVFTRPLRRHAKQVGTAQDLIRRRGPAAVFVGRFIAFFRPLVPSLAGMSRMPYCRFLFYNALGGVAWGVGFTLLGYFAGVAYTRVEGMVGGVAAIAIVVIIALLVWYLRRHRSRDHEPSDDSGGRNP
ncbi:DedA family protein [Kitasatospora sp. NPDC001159]